MTAVSTLGASTSGTVRERLAYLRSTSPVPLDRLRDVRFAAVARRASVRVSGAGKRSATSLGNTFQGTVPEQWTPPLTSLLSGLVRITPFSLTVGSDAGSIDWRLGVWTDGGADAGGSTVRLEALKAGLRASQQGVEFSEAPRDEAREWAIGGWVIGVPSAPRPSSADPRSGWDRVITAMGGASWNVVITAEPFPGASINTLRDGLLEEWRRTRQDADSSHLGNPLADHYAELLKKAVHGCDEAALLGAWRTGVYLLGDPASYLQLEAVWRAAFGGSAPERDPLQSYPDQNVPELARWWGLPGDINGAAPGAYRRPYSHQSILTSRELASYVCLPEQEHPGYTVRTSASFSVAHPAPAHPGRAVNLGAVVVHGEPTSGRYDVGVDDLTRHTFVAGLTGAGKTNTVVHLVLECARQGVPFLVIEPAKAEYRALLAHPELADTIRVFTVGKESVSPLRLNPLEVPPGVDVSEHVDLLKSTFAGSFAMWVPLPQILEQALIELYSDRGWDLATGGNARAVDGRMPSSPTLSDLVATIEHIVPTLGYKQESTQEISAALVGRLKALTRGSRGLMLDVQTSVPTAELLSAPTIVELEGLADDDDKAFVMGLLLTRLYEHRRAENRQRTAEYVPGTLRHLLVVEEAHRLLSKSEQAADSYHADPSGAFVGLFGQMLAEIRSYGQAIAIVDQVPVRLAPEVLKNTNLKICHRLVAKDDRDAVAGTMAMSEEQSAYLATLKPGRTAVFSEGDHMPVLVDVQQVKDHTGDRVITDADVTTAMQTWRHRPDVAGFFRGRASCLRTCATPEMCRSAAALSQTSAGRLLGTRLLGSLLEHPDGFDFGWRELVALASAELAGHDDLSGLVTALGAHLLTDRIERRADQGRWTTDVVEAATAAVVDVVLERAQTPGDWLGRTPARAVLVNLLLETMHRWHDPYPLCSAICPDQICRYRDPVRDVVLEPRHTRLWADPREQADPDGFIAERSVFVAKDLVDAPQEAPAGSEPLAAAQYRATACAIQLRITQDSDGHTDPRRTAHIIGLTGWDLHS